MGRLGGNDAFSGSCKHPICHASSLPKDDCNERIFTRQQVCFKFQPSMTQTTTRHESPSRDKEEPTRMPKSSELNS